jgi:putative DNA primase/helicase
MEKLLPQHLSDLGKSTITKESVAKYEFSSISKDEAGKLLGFNVPSGGWMLKYPNSDFLKFKPDNPTGKAKYLSPIGMKQGLFITQLAKSKHDDITVPYYVCEGEKKAIALEQLGYAAISIPGVWNFSSQGHYNEILSQLNLKGRECFIIFDSDKYKNEHVLRAEMRFAECLNSFGAKVRIVNLDGALGKGIDDQIQIFTDGNNLVDLKTNYIDKAELYESYADRCQVMFKGEGLVVVADNICKQNKLIFCAEKFYIYKEGVYRGIDDEVVRRWIIQEMGVKVSYYKVNEVLYFMRTCAHIETEKMNSSPYLNLKNGLFNIETGILSSHDPAVYSTIQINVNYKPETSCPKWIQALDEICEGNNDKVDTIQEFFGLCLTGEMKYEKALIFIGEGANGKSVILNTIEEVIGKENCSAIALEKFNNSHYIANLFGKATNISIETNAKSEVYDSTFKAIVSGDSIEADPKFKKPFKFHATCKLIFAMNTLPRVDDKTDAFFRRLLIIRFSRVFKEEEQNKNLKYELLKEMDGIFLWCVKGYVRLKERGHFKEINSIRQEIEEYKKENNNVLIFIEEECTLAPGPFITKEQLYRAYMDFCNKNGYRQLNKANFGKAIKKHFKLNPDSRMGDKNGTRIWEGIGLLTDRQF